MSTQQFVQMLSKVNEEMQSMLMLWKIRITPKQLHIIEHDNEERTQMTLIIGHSR